MTTTLQSALPAFVDSNMLNDQLDNKSSNKSRRTSFVTPEKLLSQKHKHQHRQDQQLNSPKDPPSSPWSPAPKTPTTKSSPQSALPESGKKPGSKVSHVICKFYKAGNCSAGSACQFSHNLPEVGQGKPICQWFVKGNCRFAHKCALAHILPGQPMSMDRKNKRAAQAAAREAAAPINTALANANEHHALAGSPHDLSFHRNQHSANSHSDSTDPSDYGQSDIGHSNHAHLNSINLHSHLLSDFDGEQTPNLTDELEFGLPDDFTHPSLRSHHLGYPLSPHQHAHPANYSVAVPSPIQTHLTTDVFGDHPSYAYNSRPVSPAQPRVPISIARSPARPRDQSPSPFGYGSPFSAPGSRSVFLPRPGSFSSEDGFPKRAPSVGASPRQPSFVNNHSHSDDGTIWNHLDAEDDVTELLPSSLHSLLTPEERQRQHIRKHTHQLFSQSVPVDHPITKSLSGLPRPAIVLQDPPSLCVSPLPTLSVCSRSPPNMMLAHQRETSASTLRGQGHAQLSSSYIPPSHNMDNWQTVHQNVEISQHPQTLSPSLISSSRQDNQIYGHEPGSSLPQGLAAGLSRLHFQPPLHTGLTPSCSPSSNGIMNSSANGHGPFGRDGTASPPASNATFATTTTSTYFNPSLKGSDEFNGNNLRTPSALSQRLAGLNSSSSSTTTGLNGINSSTAAIGRPLYANSSPLSRNVSFGFGAYQPTEEEESFEHSHPSHSQQDRYHSNHNNRLRDLYNDDDAPFELEI